jgi:hypothetical protein
MGGSSAVRGQSFMGPPRGAARGYRRGWLSNILTFETMITGPVIHLVYWAGLGVVLLAAFGVVGASLGVGIRAISEKSWETLLVVIPGLVGGLLIVLAGGLLWRAFCEFYVVIFRISDDLGALRRAAEEEQRRAGPSA